MDTEKGKGVHAEIFLLNKSSFPPWSWGQRLGLWFLPLLNKLIFPTRFFRYRRKSSAAIEMKRRPWLLVFALLFGFSLFITLSSAADSISVNQSLSGAQTIVSSGGIFELGFFTPGNSSNYYIGVWYKQVSLQTIVWVANREKPISDRFSSVLKFSVGNLVLLNEEKLPVWSTNLSSSGSVRAVILDNGNFVLKDSSNSTKPLWQSFDYPTHTWLPGSKIGLNKITNENQVLTSWKNSEDPASGLSSLELDPNQTNAYIIVWNMTNSYWTSGPWNGEIFSLVPEMRSNYLYNFSYHDNANESYFTYSLYDSSIISRFVIDVSGQIKQLTWLESSKQWNLFWSQPRRQCQVYAYCGKFGICSENSLPFCSCLTGFEPRSANKWSLADYSDGCMRKTNLSCGNANQNSQADRFLTMSSMSLPPNSQSVSVRSDEQCTSTCLTNCSCSAYVYDDGGCQIWTEDLLDLQQLSAGNGKTLKLRLAASEFSTSKNNSGVVIGAIVGSVIGIAILLGLLIFVIVRRRKRTVGAGKTVEGSLLAFGYKDLQNATKNFSEKLGGGGFGSVFKGTLADSTVVAVKKLQSVSQGEKQFRTEVCTIGTVQHVNLVRLRGFCSEGNRKLLVYEYMPNGSLDSHLYHEKLLSWKTRYQIALGTARGLAYLHEECRDCIIHCDIKPENILLDSQFCPKVADFGLAKLVGREFSRVLTTMRGTRGYLAPEWISGVAITAKADVFSFGMMLFEIVSGRRNSEQAEDGKVKFFPSWAAKVIHEEGNALSLLDPRLEGDACADEVIRVCKVACWCVQDEEINRPPMVQVAQILEGVLDVNTPPIPRSLQLFAENQEQIIFFTESSSNPSSETWSNTLTATSQVKSITSSTSSKL